jgi:hypothetical protein
VRCLWRAALSKMCFNVCYCAYVYQMSHRRTLQVFAKMDVPIPAKLWAQLHADWMPAVARGFRATGAHIVRDLIHLFANVKANTSDSGQAMVPNAGELSDPENDQLAEVPSEGDDDRPRSRARKDKYFVNGSGRVGDMVGNTMVRSCSQSDGQFC